MSVSTLPVECPAIWERCQLRAFDHLPLQSPEAGLYWGGESSNPLVKSDCMREKYPPLGAARGFKSER